MTCSSGEGAGLWKKGRISSKEAGASWQSVGPRELFSRCQAGAELRTGPLFSLRSCQSQILAYAVLTVRTRLIRILALTLEIR